MVSESIKNSSSPHFWWLFSLLGIAVIILVAYILTCKVVGADMIMEYISYASVILSITLSIFAILYTYTSNTQIQQQFEKINSAANSITSTSSALTATSEQLKGNLDVILKHLESIDDKQQEISGQMNNINTHLGEKVNQIKNMPTQKGNVAKNSWWHS